MRDGVREMGDVGRSRRLAKVAWPLLIVLLVCSGLALVFAQRRRTVTPPAGNSAAGPRAINVRAGGSLQRALEEARPGDTIVLEAGASFTGPFTLPNKGASNEWITLRSSAPDSAMPAESERVTPSAAPLLPKLLSPGDGEAALQTASGAHHYRLVGLEIRTATADALVYDLVKLGDASPAQNSLDKVPHHLVLDRCLITAFPKQTLKRGIALNSAETTVVNSHVAGFKSAEQDSQAIGGWNGPGPFRIVNNYIEAAGENLLFGGATPAIRGLVPSDIEIRRNHFFKPLSWRRGEPSYAGARWSVKNILELKSARRVVIEANVLENCWGDVSSGYGTINLTVRGDSGPQATIEDVLIQNNIVAHAPNGLNILGRDTSQPSGRGRGVRVVNNLFVDIDGKRWGGDGEFLKLSDMPGVVVDHNTVLHTGNVLTIYGPASEGLVFTNNLLPHNSYGLIGQDRASGTDTLRAYAPGAIVRRNLIAGADARAYPSDNFYPTKLAKMDLADLAGGDYSLAPGSAYRGKATDGRDVGCDFRMLNEATAGVVRR
ncbi:MAG TPA: hypothetical protein VEX60_02140 [Pyrinomonadaceae bacterium]|nr:hypothetical protein [Pyrinomonadaceae bacterium]